MMMVAETRYFLRNHPAALYRFFLRQPRPHPPMSAPAHCSPTWRSLIATEHASLRLSKRRITCFQPTSQGYSTCETLHSGRNGCWHIWNSALAEVAARTSKVAV